MKTIRKNIDESLKYFCGDSVISHSGYPKRFFPQGQRNIFAIENQICLRCNIEYDLLIVALINKDSDMENLKCQEAVNTEEIIVDMKTMINQLH